MDMSKKHLVLIVIASILLLTVGFRFIDLTQDDELTSEELHSKRVALVSQELDVEEKSILLEKRVLAEGYNVTANGTEYIAVFNDNATEIVTFTKK